MQKVKSFLIVILLFAVMSSNVMAQAPAKIADPTAASKKMAKALSEITGVAISPLLGMGAVGCVKYFRTAPEKRYQLPWFASPLFWIPAFVLVGLCFLKDAAGATVMPTIVKKPLDALEAVEHKISGLIAVGAFVPIVAAIFQAPDEAPNSASLASAGFAAIDLHWLYNALIIPFAMVAFVLVWLASNAINILILLSPFTTIDTSLKLFRTFILGTVCASAWANPWVGAAWALVIILFSYLIAGWSFRLTHFGLVFLWDFFTGRKHRFKLAVDQNRMFLGRKIEKAPARTYGKLSRNGSGELVFEYRPFLVMPRRTLIMPAGIYETGRGLFYSEILRVDGDSAKTLILLPPRYLSHEEEVSRHYSLAGTRDVGLRAAWAWVKSLFVGRAVPA